MGSLVFVRRNFMYKATGIETYFTPLREISVLLRALSANITSSANHLLQAQPI